MHMIINREYIKYLERINKSIKELRIVQSHPPKVSQISRATGLTEEHVLEAIEFGSKTFFRTSPYTQRTFYKNAKA